MTNVWYIASREFKHFFQTPYALVILTIFFVLVGSYFNTNLTTYLEYSSPNSTHKIYGINITTHLIIPYLASVVHVLVFVIPLITMSSFAEEKKMSTYDLLVSYPLRPTEILFGKYLGLLFICFSLLALTGIYLVLPFIRGEPHLPVILTTYIGYSLFILLYVSIGTLASLLTENQIVAAIISYSVILCASLLQYLAFVSPAPWDRVLSNFLLIAHLDSFRKGLIYMGDIFTYLGSAVIILMFGLLKIRKHYIR